MEFNILDINKIIDGKLYLGEKTGKEIFEGAFIDTRLVTENSIFFAIRGQNVDPHKFIPDISNKCLLVIGDREINSVLDECNVSNFVGAYIQVDNVIKAMAKLAAAYRLSIKAKIIGVVGSVGKTTTKETIADVLAVSYKVSRTSGNHNNIIGLPLTLLNIKRNSDYAVVEMGISDFNEMSKLGEIARPDTVVMTNIGHCHLEKLIDRNGVLKAKSEIFDYLNSEAHIYLNGDDDLLRKLNEINTNLGVKNPVFCGKNKYNLCKGYNITVDKNNINMSISYKDGNFENLEFHIKGAYNIYNILFATAIGIDEKMEFIDVKKGLDKKRNLNGRANFIKVDDELVVIDDCYNANLESMSASLEILSREEGEKIAVLGDMLELGENSDSIHRLIGEKILTLDIDKVYLIGEKAKNIYDVLVENGKKETSSYYINNDDFIQSKELDNIKGKRYILLKASHGMSFDKIKDMLIKNDK